LEHVLVFFEISRELVVALNLILAVFFSAFLRRLLINLGLSHFFDFLMFLS
jgi:hypothetical protein